MIHSHHLWSSAMTANLWTYKIRHASSIINETPCLCLNYKSTQIQMFSKSKVDSNPSQWKPLFCPVYEIASPLAVGQPFDKLKEKITTGVYLGISTINSRALGFVIIFSMVMLSPQFRVAFDSSLATSNGWYWNIVPPRYSQSMCGFIKGNKSVIVHSEQHDL